ncbi:MAG: valine--tRNA ligase [Phycisphaerae bacterium]|nr:valine--tRNA ligase [Phycisphaerae bacterium]
MPANIILEKTYDPQHVETEMYRLWEAADSFEAGPDDRPPEERYVIVIPPPNVTGALHLGHAINNTLQDVLIRWHRMKGQNTLWLPGVDHAGIATQAVVEKRIREEEGLTRHEIGREQLVQRIWKWKDQYQKRIIQQLKLMGCSCDWRRTRFTLDEGLARAVRAMFFRLFKDGLIFRGKRLVNWDTQLQTAVADDEVYHEAVKGHFWHFKYPVIDPQAGEPEHVHIATTRPETMLGDTAVAVHPDPEGFLNKREKELRGKLDTASAKETQEIGKQLELLQERRDIHLAGLLRLREMAAVGRKVMLPLVQRPIPLVHDEWADPTKGSGCVKITPAHDPNDYDVGRRHSLPMVNVLTSDGKVAPIVEPDGTVNPHSDKYADLNFTGQGRDKVVADLEAAGLLEKVEDHEMDVGHSDRSKKRIEPYLSDQWFLDMGDRAEGVTLGDGSKTTGLAQAAMDAVTDGRVKIFPERYAKTYLDWLGEKREWCISRQLWWGHRIPIWHCKTATEEDIKAAFKGRDDIVYHYDEQKQQWLICAETEDLPADAIDGHQLEQDPDVLDTWFSSQLWPFSTMNWPGWEDGLRYYYPSNVLITSRDIITLWVARMVLSGLYCIGKVPFPHVYIHAKILDGRGEGMSKSKGNGVDPLDIIEVYGADALRYALVDMTTGIQDVRMPVEYRCPHCHSLTPQTASNMTAKTLKCRDCGKTFATQWADDTTIEQHGRALMVSDKFEVGRNFCNKLWNAARFAFLNLEGVGCEPLEIATLPPEDRWILARLNQAIVDSQEALNEYRYSASIKYLRDFFWDSLCDWYIELTKPRMSGGQQGGQAKQVLAFCLDQILRLLHPAMPFITERLWQQLNALAPRRGLPGVAEPSSSELLIVAESPPQQGWPGLTDPAILELFADIQSVTRGVREMRNSHKVSPKQPVKVTVRAPASHIDLLAHHAHIIEEMGNVEDLRIVAETGRPANSASAVIGGLQIYVHNISNDEQERSRITKELAQTDKLIQGKQSKLSNERFVKHAKSEVVEAERRRLAEFQARKEQLEAALLELR